MLNIRLRRIVFFILLACLSNHSLSQENPSQTNENSSFENGNVSHLDTNKLSYIFDDFSSQFLPSDIQQFTINDEAHAFISIQSELPVTSGTLLFLNSEAQFKSKAQDTFVLAEILASKGWNSIIAVLPDLASTALDPNADGQEQQNTKQSSQSSDSLGNDSLGNDSQNEATPNSSNEPLTTENSNKSFAATTSSKTYLTRFSQAHIQHCSVQIENYTSSLLNQLQGQTGRLVVLAEGVSAFCFLVSDVQGVDAIVSLSPFVPDHESNNTIPQLIADTQAPLLDLTSPYESHWARKTNKARRVAAHKNLKTHYRQRELMGHANSAHQHAMMAKEIYGWLRYLGF